MPYLINALRMSSNPIASGSLLRLRRLVEPELPDRGLELLPEGLRALPDLDVLPSSDVLGFLAVDSDAFGFLAVVASDDLGFLALLDAAGFEDGLRGLAGLAGAWSGAAASISLSARSSSPLWLMPHSATTITGWLRPTRRL